MKLVGLWIGLTVSLVYCASVGVYMNLKTDWDHEVEKVRTRVLRQENFEEFEEDLGES